MLAHKQSDYTRPKLTERNSAIHRTNCYMYPVESTKE